MQPQQPNFVQENRYHDDEIELIDYLRVLWKWKWMIIMITFVCMVVAGVVSFVMPSIYEVSMAIEPGIIGIDENGRLIDLDSAENIKAKIENDIYSSRIHKNLNIDPRRTQIKFKAANQKGTNLINISSEWTQDQIVTGITTLEQLLIELSHDYKDIIQAKTKGIDSVIILKLSNIQGKKNQIDSQLSILKNIKVRKNKLNQEVMALNNNIKRITQQQDKVLKGKIGDGSILSLFYLAIVQQNMAYFNQLNNQLNGLKSKEDEILTNVEQLKQDVNNINMEIDRLNIEKDYIKHIKLIGKPEASIFPIKPKKELNIALACVVGFMLAVFIAFFAEYIQKVKKEC